MNVTPEVLKDYVFGELNESDRRAVEAATAADGALRDELARLQLTQSALAIAAEQRRWVDARGSAKASTVALVAAYGSYVGRPTQSFQQA